MIYHRFERFTYYKPPAMPEVVDTLARPFVLPPNTPKEQVRTLRHAFQQVLKDNELVLEAQKSQLEIAPVTAEELEKAVGKLFSLDSVLTDRLNEILYK